MELTNEFVVGIGVKEAWALLTDVERIAPCMPGAELQEVEGDDYKGVVKVKVGPITAQYKGKANFVERDEPHRAVLRAEGRDTRGQGNASATITASLAPEGDGTRVSVVTDLTITGRAAQFGRGVLADVSSKLMGQFVECLETSLLAGDGGASGEGPAGATDAAQAVGATDGATATATAPRQVEHRPAEPVDLLETAGAPIAKRLAPVVLGLLVFWWVQRRVRRLFRGRS